MLVTGCSRVDAVPRLVTGIVTYLLRLHSAVYFKDVHTKMAHSKVTMDMKSLTFNAFGVILSAVDDAPRALLCVSIAYYCDTNLCKHLRAHPIVWVQTCIG